MTAMLDFVRGTPAFDNVISVVGNKRLVGTPKKAAPDSGCVEYIKY